MSSPLGKKVVPPAPAPEVGGMKHLHGNIYVDSDGKMHNMQPDPCYVCGAIVRPPDCAKCQVELHYDW